MGKRNNSPATARWALLGVIVVVLLLAAAWRWTPLQTYAQPRMLAGLLQTLRHSPWAPLIVAGLYLLGSAVLFPNTILNLATVLGFGTQLGPPLAMGGSLLAGLAFYLLGRRYGEAPLRRLRLRSVERLQQLLRRGGLATMLSLRLLPVAPYSVANLMAGAARVPILTFLLGSFLGLLPGILMVTAFGHQLRRMLKHPGPAEFAILAAVVLAGLGLMAWLRHRLEREAGTLRTA